MCDQKKENVNMKENGEKYGSLRATRIKEHVNIRKWEDGLCMQPEKRKR